MVIFVTKQIFHVIFVKTQQAYFEQACALDARLQAIYANPHLWYSCLHHAQSSPPHGIGFYCMNID